MHIDILSVCCPQVLDEVVLEALDLVVLALPHDDILQLSACSSPLTPTLPSCRERTGRPLLRAFPVPQNAKVPWCSSPRGGSGIVGQPVLSCNRNGYN